MTEIEMRFKSAIVKEQEHSKALEEALTKQQATFEAFLTKAHETYVEHLCKALEDTEKKERELDASEQKLLEKLNSFSECEKEQNEELRALLIALKKALKNF